jgi:hypothetical protein
MAVFTLTGRTTRIAPIISARCFTRNTVRSSFVVLSTAICTFSDRLVVQDRG